MSIGAENSANKAFAEFFKKGGIKKQSAKTATNIAISRNALVLPLDNVQTIKLVVLACPPVKVGKYFARTVCNRPKRVFADKAGQPGNFA